MEEMASLWSYQENVDDLNQKLLFTTLELEKLKLESSEEMIKNKEYVKQLLQLLKIAIQERDEARNQLQNFINKSMSLTSAAENLPMLAQVQSDGPLLKPGRANSSITESNSLSKTYNYQSRCSSPKDSLFDAVSSPELSNINLVGNQSLVQDCNLANSTVLNNEVNPVVPKVDRASLIIDNLIRGRPLPQKGKLLDAVSEAGPLLHNLLMAGPLPRWRNPPRIQPFQIPPVSIRGCETDVFAQKLESNLNQMASRTMNSQPYALMSCGSSQILSAPMLNFANVSSGSCLGTAGTTANSSLSLGKRQRLY